MEQIPEEGKQSESFVTHKAKNPKNVKKYLEEKLYPDLRKALDRVKL